MKVAMIFLLTSLSFFASFAQAEQSLCRASLLKMLGVPQAATLDFKKHLVGTVQDLNLDSATSVFQKGGPCDLAIQVYQQAGKNALVYVEDSHSYLDPFNHSVTADDSSDSCHSDTNDTEVSGDDSFTQDSGWHNSFSTAFDLTHNSDGSFTLKTQQERTYLVCKGSLH